MGNKTQELFEYDLSFGAQVGGCDEAGRGPLAGSLVVAACIMPLDKMIDGINDSKKLSEAKRETLFDEIIKVAKYKVSVIEFDEIDKINILNATKKGMKDAIDGLDFNGLMLVDAVKIAAKTPTKAIIRGDGISYNIAAASIIAKVTRDRLMYGLDLKYPQYNFKQNKGYATKQHIAALREFGASEIHRLTYLKNFFESIKAERGQANE